MATDVARWLAEALDAARLIAARVRPDVADALAEAAGKRLAGLPEVSAATLRPYGAAKWAVDASLGDVPPLTRPPSSGLEFPVAEAVVYDDAADSQYRKTWRDVRAEIVADTVDALLGRLKDLGSDAVTEAVDTLEPVIDAVVDGTVHRDRPRWTDQQKRLLGWVEALVAPARETALAAHGTIPGVKQTPGMRRTRSTRTSGPASAPIRPPDDTGRAWVYHDDRAEMVTDEQARAILATIDRKPVKVGTEREEESWDRLQRAMRPAREAGRKSGKQKGRLGGPAVIR